MKPLTRLENFLAKIAGLANDNLIPRTRMEWFLNAISEKSGSSFTDLRKEEFMAPAESTFVEKVIENPPTEISLGGQTVTMPGSKYTVARAELPPLVLPAKQPDKYGLFIDGEEVDQLYALDSEDPVSADDETRPFIIAGNGWSVGEAPDKTIVITYRGEDYAKYLGTHTVCILAYYINPTDEFAYAVKKVISTQSAATSAS